MKTAGLQVSHGSGAGHGGGHAGREDDAQRQRRPGDGYCDLLETGRRKFIVDLSGLTHIDSTGIGTFIASLGKVSQAGGALAMAGAGGMVREGFRVTRLDKVFRFFPDVESARATL